MAMIPLTAELLAKRITVLYSATVAEHGPVDAMLFSIIECNACGLVFDVLDGFPVGWMTEFDPADGWRDLCEKCSP